MIPKIIFSLMAVFVFSNISSAQIANARLTFSESVSPSGVPTGTVTFTGLEGPELQVFEAQLPARTEAGCFASRDFSSARLVSRDRASVSYDADTSQYKFTWTVTRDRKENCRVLLVGRSVALTDLAVWQSNYGSTALSDSIGGDNVSYGRGAYQIRLDDTSTSASVWVKSIRLRMAR
jgi:hypothetical protein